MVASAAPGDGKTTVARHLAAAAARMGSRVLLLEADLRRPTIALQLDIASGLVAGSSLPPNPGELIESHAMESLLQQAKSKYDLIVVDTPPLTAVSDAFPLLGKVDGVIIVGRVGRNRRDIAQRLHETLTGAGAPLLGVVANGFKSGRLSGYGYSYDYAAGVKGAPTDDAASANGASASDEPVPTAKS